MPAFFTALSVIGIIVGLFMVNRGMTGHELGPVLVLVIGLFVVIKEVMDILVAGR
ncbi:hypothetical protein HYY74_05755 [Candidatus Woesearchaeota archaeon]|nr:hypothetical protein [Candidatus Woesearchaeota archaeon]